MGVEAVGSIVALSLCLIATCLGRERIGVLWRAAGRYVDGRRRRRPTPLTVHGRPIELIARDVHRLGLRFRCFGPGMSFAQFEGRRCAYEQVLDEACRALGVEHLLGVLPPGTDLDTERERVEALLGGCGLPLDDAA